MASDDLIDFNVIESHKENIQALPSGRSAKALAQVYSPSLLGAQPSPITTNDANVVPRKAFEKELETIDEADDPLDVYDRYVKWTLDTYPTPQSTQSQLLPLLERATKAFQSSAHYKNDPRYLRLWLHYIRLFSDAPREVFVFLARHEIGVNLALYYEEFAAWLENSGRWTQAEEVYRLGLEKEARPAERLLRKFGEFERRNEARERDPAEPNSPVLPKVRPALMAKIDPFAASSPSATQQQQGQSGSSTASKKSKGSKMAIFSDADEPARPESGGSSKGWDNIGSLSERKKENTVEARPWVGEKLIAGKTNGGMQKMMVFKDHSSLNQSLRRDVLVPSSVSARDDQWVLNPRTGRMEYVFVNLEAIYPDPKKPSVEYCFEELRVMNRGLRNKNWSSETSASQTIWLNVESEQNIDTREVEQSEQDGQTMADEEMLSTNSAATPAKEEAVAVTKPKQRGFEIFEDALDQPVLKKASEVKEEKVLVETFSKTMALNDENNENAPPQTDKGADFAKKLRREERANRTRKIQVMDVKHIKNETKTIQLNLDSPTGPGKLKRKKSGERAEPTMTINTREAMDEIYGIFSQPLPSQAEQSEEDDEDDDSEDDEDDYTTGDESTATGKLSGPPSEYGDDTRNEVLGASRSGAAAADDDGRTEVSNWSDFTTSKHVPKEAESSSAPESAQSTTWDVYEEEKSEEPSESVVREDLITPVNEEPHTRFVPVPPEGYEPPTGQYRDPVVVANNRLPFMTPIVERTESSLGAATTKSDKDYFSAKKTPSRSKAGGPNAPLPEAAGCLDSSPFQEVVSADLAEDRRKVLQPVRTKSTKGTISLGHGTAKAQIAAKAPKASNADGQHKGPIILDEQCNPMDPALRETILSQISPSLSSFDGYHEHLSTDSGRTAEIKKFIRTLAKASKSGTNLEKTAQTLSLPPTLTFQKADGPYTIKRELGAGTFAPVYLVENNAAVTASEEAEDENRDNHRSVGSATHRKPLEAIKMEEPASTWEFYMLRQCHRRLGVSRAADSIVRAHEMHLYRDECFLVEEYRDQGTLLDLINLARSGSEGGGMEEALAMFFAVELLRTVESLHAKGLVHGDLKGDNVLVRLEDPGSETDWSPTYFSSGAHGWASKGVCLIDLGRGIDMKCFVPGVAFIADWPTTDADCAEMRELRPWTYQIDYHGLAGVLHSLLFGKYMETLVEKKSTTAGAAVSAGGMGGLSGLAANNNKSYRIRDPLKRYWQTAIWADAFDLLLNPLAHVAHEEGAKMPILKGMKSVRERMETWLEENCDRGVGLKGMIARMETAIRERRRKSGKLV